MPKIQYQDIKFTSGSRDIIAKANAIIAEYTAAGFDLTLRQLYYQFVARAFLVNKDSEYKRLGSIINDARYAGLIDWLSITDRTRNLRANSHWTTPGSIIGSAAYSYANDKWIGQPYRPEVWIEKDALVGVIAGVCTELDVPHFSCRGYTSASEVWAAAQRLLSHKRHNQNPIIIHLGDHDPSGIDMTRDIHDRLSLFCGFDVPVKRVALNFDQIEEFNPPPNPAKVTDSRSDGYIAEYGTESWELDALDPRTLEEIVRAAINEIINQDLFDEAKEHEENDRRILTAASERWADVAAYLEGEN